MRLTKITTQQVTLAAVGSAAIALLIALYMGRSIATPLQQLTNAATGFAAGRTDISMPRARADEIGELAKAFNNMVQRRKQAEEALWRTRDELEVRVVKRTAELADANTVLQQEVAERRLAEEAVKSSEQRFRQIAETIQDVFWMVTPDLREIIYVSPAYERIWGRTVESLHAHALDWSEAIVEEDRARVFAVFGGISSSRSAASAEYRIRRPDGEVRWISAHGFPIDDEAGRLYRITGVARDITQQKRMESRLIEGSKLQTVGQLAGGIAHDFNTILTAIIGYAELIEQEVPADGPLFKSAEQIGKSATRAATLTQQLLAFSRKQMLQPELIDLNAIVSGIDVVLRRLLSDAVEVRTAANARHPWVKADVGQVQQVLISLALNARDAMPRGGKLTFETADVTLDETYAASHSEVSAGEYTMIAITDTGDGIPNDVKPHLFEPFFTTKPQGEGTGLGLAMCYGILKQSRGHISVYSEVGHGTTFKVYLPRAERMATKQAPAPSLPEPTLSSGTETILLVEDDAALRGLAGIVLEKQGYRVLTAANGLEAAEIAERGAANIDLLLTDVVMPQMGGKELADRLQPSHPRMKVLFTSAYTEDAIVHHGILDPGIDFLRKPYTPTALSRQARAALDRHALSERI